MNENQTLSVRPSGKKWFLILGGALVVYVLSWGVVFAMYGTGRFQMPVPEWIKAFYFPVRWVQNNTILSSPLREYLFWWARTLTR